MKKLPKDELLKLFKKIGFFKKFSDEELDKLSSVDSFIINYEKETSIIQEGDTDNSFFILLKGQVYINKSSLPSIKLAELKPGAVFGEISFLNKRPRTTNVIAQTTSLVLRLSPKLLTILGPDIETKIKYQMIIVLINRLDHLNKALISSIRFLPNE